MFNKNNKKDPTEPKSHTHRATRADGFLLSPAGFMSSTLSLVTGSAPSMRLIAGGMLAAVAITFSVRNGGHGQRGKGILWRTPALTNLRLALQLLAQFVTVCTFAAIASLPAHAVTPVIGAGYYHSAIVARDGSLWMWGGVGRASGGPEIESPVRIEVIDSAVSVVLGSNVPAYESDLVLKADGTVWALTWPGGLPSLLGSRTPSVAQVQGLSEIVAMSGGGSHVLALRRDGSVWALGANDHGQLGNGTKVSSTTPVRVIGLGNVVGIATGYFHSLALRADGTVWSFGYDLCRELGLGGPATSPPQEVSIPTKVPGLPMIRQIGARGEKSLALSADGRVFRWGSPASDAGICVNDPKQVSGLPIIVELAVGYRHEIAQAEDGSLWSWGNNSYGQLGTGAAPATDFPVRHPTVDGAVAVAAGDGYSIAMLGDGRLMGWGLNKNGQLGNGQHGSFSLVPVQIPGLSDIVAIKANYIGSTFRRSNGELWMIGPNSGGDYANSPAPVQKLAGSTVVDAALTTQQISMNGLYAVKSDGTVWLSQYGGPAAQVVGLDSVVQVESGRDHTLALKSDGTVWGWGGNSKGQLGNGTNADSSTAVRAVGLSDVVKIGVGSQQSYALRRDGTVWIWGGTRCHNSAAGPNVPTQFENPKATEVQDISNGWTYIDGFLFQRRDGTSYSFPWSPAYNLDCSYLGPTNIPALTNARSATQTSSGGVLAALSDGSVWENVTTLNFIDGAWWSSGRTDQGRIVEGLQNRAIVKSGVRESIKRQPC